MFMSSLKIKVKKTWDVRIPLLHNDYELKAIEHDSSTESCYVSFFHFFKIYRICSYNCVRFGDLIMGGGALKFPPVNF